MNVDSIIFPDDGVVNSISKRQVNNILNLIYQIPERIVDNRHSVVNQRQQQQLNQSPIAPTRNPIQPSPSQSQLINYNYDPITDFAWTVFKVSYQRRVSIVILEVLR